MGGTGAGTRELITTSLLPAAGRPQIQSLAFVTSISVASFLGTAPISTLSGLNRIVHNKSPDYWVTLMGTLAAGGTPVAVQVSIPPLGLFFVPANMYSSATQPGLIVANSAWPIPVPLSGQGSTLVPVATNQTAVTIDLLSEQ